MLGGYEMDFLKELFNGQALTFEQLQSAVQEKGYKLADLSKGDYVSKNKFDDAIKAKDNEINTLNGTIATRDTDLADLNAKLSAAGTDAEKLSQLSTEFSSLQTKYDNDVKSYKEQLKKQAYEFAVKDFANSKNFTSKAAKRDFINSMIAKDLKMDKDIILGAEDFVKAYSVDNEDAFVAEPSIPEKSKPQFVSPTISESQVANGGLFDNAFNFTGVRPKESVK